MKKLQINMKAFSHIRLLLALTISCFVQQVSAKEDCTTSNSDNPCNYAIEDNSDFDIPRPPASCSNSGIAIPNNIRAHNIKSSTIPRSNFSSITKWYVEDGDVQRFQLHNGDTNQKPGASVKRPRLETFSPRWKRGSWQEFSADYYLSDWKVGQTYAIFQIKTNDASNFIIQGLIDKNGKLSVARRSKGSIQLDKNVYKKPFNFRVRSNGSKFEVYYNCKLVIAENHPQPQLENNKTEYGFRWGLYRQKTSDDKQIGTTTMYVTGANFDGSSPTPTPTPTPSVGPDGYTFATNEDGTVKVSGTVNIAYGANGKFKFLKNVSSNTPCNNATFGDPISGVKKACYIQKVSGIDGGKVTSTTNQTAITTTTGDGVADVVKFKNTSTSGASYRYLITDENGNILTTETSSHDFEGASVGICKVYGIAYQGTLSVGGKNVKNTGLATGAFDLSSNAIVVTRKAKTTTPTPPSGGPDGYTYATDEGGTVNVSGTVNIAYGANGKFNFLKNVSANTPCNNATFGDPIFSVKKSCYIQKASTTNPNPTPPTTGNCSFGTPTSGRLASFERASYTNIFVLGNGPNVSNIKKFRISWNAGSNKLTQFAFNTANGNPSYYVDLRGKIEQKFNNSNPSVKITGSGIGVDGDYWVTKRGNDFVMASKDGKFSIYCSATSSKPTCTGQKAALQETVISLYPNPAQETLNISGLTAENAIVTISDLLGKVVVSTSLTKGQNSLNISKLKAGLYIVSFTSDNGTISQRTVVVE